MNEPIWTYVFKKRTLNIFRDGAFGLGVVYSDGYWGLTFGPFVVSLATHGEV